MKQIFFAVMAMGLVGCSGHFVTHKGVGSENCDSNGACKGVPFYLSEPRIETKHLTYTPAVGGKPARYSDKTGNEGCLAVNAEVVVNRRSEDLRYLSYQPGFFEYAKLSVDLNDNGTVSKVSVEPSSGLKEAAEAISSLADAYKVVRVDARADRNVSADTPICTAEAPRM
ncbi:hypothetical protein NJC38_02800 [Pseudomonas sp. 21LCFQ010]|uniref:hypothetical protein n=1 Tax=Pseudomonas sp. 21LCFQ010 TaxID=2957506 RepID=UPI0020977DC2|nr:hypothetical protein [Pseudomonas sp. 21LCFQ010]MCO8161080.1 hypothetical protein [Pseudomonas sp. 21LCFQ010]